MVFYLVYPLNIIWVVFIGLPVSILFELIGFFDHHLATVKRLHNLLGTARNPVRTTKEERARRHVHNACFNI